MAWSIPLFDLDVDEQEVEALRRAIESRWISMGQATHEFEERFAKAHDAEYGVAVSSATAALHLALLALDIGPGDEVICPSLTFVATSNAALYVGATPVFADIASPDNLTISAEDIERKLTERTRAIIVMHYGGFPCDMDAINEVARRAGCVVVEDAAHAPLTEYRGKKVGTLSDAGCFSFFSNKNMTTAEGGMLLTNNSNVAERVRLLRSHGMTTLSYDRFSGHASSYDVVDLGYNYRLDDIRASLGLVQLEKLPAASEKRRALWEIYRSRLSEVEGVIVPFGAAQPEDGAWLGQPYIFTIVLAYGQDRDRLRNELAEAGIQTSVHYPPVHLFKIYQDRFGYRQGDLPITESVASSIVTLPFYPSMTVEDVDYVVSAVRKAL
ncbi:MAG: DegT/DnrJ/EryC1/StrS family aminotransferase [Ardenticatenaceae bacterium]